MGETSDQIERHIQDTRNDLRGNFSELEERVKTAVDWRAQFEDRPVTMMALAFGGGVLLSALLPSVGSTRGMSSESRGNAPADHDAPGLSIKSRTSYDDKASQTLETWDSLKGALVGVATIKLSDFIEDLLPGFKQEFTRAQTRKNFDRPVSSTSGQPKSTAAGAD